MNIIISSVREYLSAWLLVLSLVMEDSCSRWRREDMSRLDPGLQKLLLKIQR